MNGIKFSLLLFLLVPCLSYSTDNETPSLASWKQSCNEAKTIISSSKESFITYSKKPIFQINSKYWNISVRGHEVLVPVSTYHFYDLKHDNQGKPEAILGSHNGFIVGFGRLDNSNFAGIYDLYPGAADILSGGAKTFFDLNILSYRYHPSDLDCKDSDAHKQQKIAYILLFKGIITAGKRGIVNAYEGVNEYKGWIEKAIWQGYTRYDVNLYDDPSYVFMINYYIRDDQFHDIPFRFGTSGKSETPRPDWLEALELALNSDTKIAWNDFKEKAHSHGLTEISKQ